MAKAEIIVRFSHEDREFLARLAQAVRRPEGAEVAASFVPWMVVTRDGPRYSWVDDQNREHWLADGESLSGGRQLYVGIFP